MSKSQLCIVCEALDQKEIWVEPGEHCRGCGAYLSDSLEDVPDDHVDDVDTGEVE